jgi:hypothetical protein
MMLLWVIKKWLELMSQISNYFNLRRLLIREARSAIAEFHGIPGNSLLAFAIYFEAACD